MLQLRKLLLTICAALLGMAVTAQVTTSSISGTVKDKSGNALEGATITATHLPSGSVYNTLSKKGGIFNISNARIGGPYRLKVEFVGQKAYEVEGFNLILGDVYDLNVVMGEDVKQITEVVVTGGRRTGATEKTGASTNINQRILTTIPTISRSLTNFTAVTPQANGTSFAGRDNRMNNIQIDGANLNNNFGLSSDLLPGGNNQPISLDAVEEVAVNVSPFDVWQGGFTGAGVNVVTKSGTNQFKGSAYYLLRTEQMNGTRIGNTKLTNLAEQTNRIIGATIGGPIIKNKLFFFISGEKEEESRPGITVTPRGGSGTGNVSNTPVDSLRKLANHLISKYNYDPGAFDNFPNFQTSNYKVLGKIDWNISNVHKLTLRYQETVGTDDRQLNNTSIPNTSTFTPPNGTSITALPNSRFSVNSMSFANSNYFFEDKIRSGALELNSSKSGNWANQFIATFSRISATRGYNGQTMPAVDIFNNDGRNYMSFGTDPFSNNNQVKNDIVNITNNFKYYRGKHTLTLGGSYEYQTVGNMFMPGSHGHYVYNTLDDFINDRAPIFYSYLFSVVPGKEAVFSAELKVGQAAAYIQDDINVSDRLKLTVGLRADAPIYLEQPLENPNITALRFPDANGNLTSYNTGAWPKSRVLLSPRVGFRWDVNGDKNTIIRGGTGLFTGRFPFVWLTNMPSGSLMYQSGSAITNPTILAGIRYSTQLDAHKNLFNPTVGAIPNNANLVMTDPNFKFPQIWRTNLAVDKRFNNGWSITLEGIITKDVNAIRLRNANLREPDARLTGADNRQAYANRTDAGRRLYSNINTAIVLENTNRGGGIVLTAQLNKALSKGLSASASYTYTAAWDITSNPGSQASSTWQGTPAVGTPNTTALGMSGFAIPHRFMAWVSYRKEYLKHLATTVTLFYEGRNQGNFSFTTNGDLNGDGISSDLMYIPKNRNEINFLPITGANPWSVDAQRDALEQYINNSKYLRKRRGQYAERNAALQPFVHTVNLQVQQDLFTNIGKRKNTLRLQADVLNFLNMLNKNWGHRFINTLSGNNPLQVASVTNGVPAYRMSLVSGQLPTQPFQVNRSLSSTWGAQVGIRYIF
ncbi:MAG TPA: carboxypeptidase regulatory-like domain-containing protein [Lacibacter sp.]|nr:carboxypeptidase regulatory-like domain-containing protein [Lacibacter sp.]HMO90032.1 carboxypeptidase regulatory-like domain-containing protein [Lacibacter sp.]